MANLKVLSILALLALSFSQTDVSSFSNLDTIKQTDIQAKFIVDFDLGQ
jgi:hypothetical protein